MNLLVDKSDKSKIFNNLMSKVSKKDYSHTVDNSSNIYNYTIPNIKLYYPEPFISTPTFLHYDLWFVHISIYQYWLWFFFIFLIIFFTISFLMTLKWCNIRFRPSRETRGVSRSKCGDLITAVVPISWAGSIITHESTDAVDYYDGFGTSEMVLGVRSYQWGWEYYYPKDLDLNYKTTDNTSSFIGKSLNYSNNNSDNIDRSVFFNLYKNSDIYNSQITPAYLLFNPVKDLNILNTSFKKSFGFSKISPKKAFKNLHNNNYYSFNNVYNRDILNMDSYLSNKLNLFNNNVVSDNIGYNVFENNSYNLLNTNSLLNSNYNFTDISGLYKYIKSVNNYNNDFIYILKKGNIFLNNLYTNYSSNLINSLNNYFYNYKEIFFKNNYSKLYKLINNIDIEGSDYSNNNLNMFNNSFFGIFKNINNYKFYSFFDINYIYNNVYYGKTNKNNFLFKIIKTKNITKPVMTSLDNITVNPVFFKDKFNNNFFYKINNAGIGEVYTSYIEEFFSLNKYLNLNNLVSKTSKLPNSFKVNETRFDIDFYDSLKTNIYNLNNIDLIKKLNFNYKVLSFKIPVSFMYSDLDFKRWNTLDLLEDSFWDLNLDDYSLYNYKKYKKLSTNNFLSKYNSNYILSNNFLNKGMIMPYYINRFDYIYIYNYDKVITENLFNSFYNYKINNFNLIKLYNNYMNPRIDLMSINIFWPDYSNKNFINFNNLNLNNGNYYLNDIFLLNLNKINRENSFFKFNNFGNLMESYKGLLSLNKSIWKVYYIYFEEARSSVFFKDLSDVSNYVPIITNKYTNLKKQFKKNSINFFKSNLYIKKNKINYINNFNYLNTKMFYTFEFPFNLSVESDSLRYSWFDWYSGYSRRIMRGLDTVKYNLNGSRIFENKYNFNNKIIPAFNKYNNYLTRLSHARKIYLPSWSYSLFIHNRFQKWNNIYSLYNLDKFYIDPYNYIIFWSNYSDWFYDSVFINKIHLNNYSFGSTSYNNPSRNYWRSIRSFGSYTFYNSKLIDILFKKELIIKSILDRKKNKFNIVDLKPQNNLLMDLKSTLIYNTDYDKFNGDIRILSFDFINRLRDRFLFLRDPITSSAIKVIDSVDDSYNNLYKKSQYKPMRKGIANMVRIQSNTAVAVPVETRIQLLTVSKDIIHSWSIPSAGIKIDCIPGYSSHKVTIFFLSGVYWGQCMEICGRFHHWMPIVVYFIKRDLFLVWCNHFIFKNKSLSGFNSGSNKVSSDFLKVVSFNKINWLDDIK